MIDRNASLRIRSLASQFPIVILSGPRQSGKTTLIRSLYPDLPYANLERPDTLAQAMDDPKAFLVQFLGGRGIIDEAQRFPQLTSWLQTIVDEAPMPGRFFLTGSNQPLLKAQVSQSLAGRAAYLSLPPFTAQELGKAGKLEPTDDSWLLKGFYPPLYDRPFDPVEWFAQYIGTYLDRDVKQLVNIRESSAFHRFLRLCAARTGQVLNLSDLARDADVSHTTAKQWLSVLEACFLVFFLRPWHENYAKRLVKSPKLYFFDVGLAGHLIGITEHSQWSLHPLRGAFFETMAVGEMVKRGFAMERCPEWFFWSAAGGAEVDLVERRGTEVHAYEIKSSATFKPEHLKNLQYWGELSGTPSERLHLLNGGRETFIHRGIDVRPWLGG
jgi:predicted AAA+ superfamily ATPase